MASPVPAKSQPLHNFTLPHLKWSKNTTNNHHRSRTRLGDSSPQQSPMRDTAPRQSPMRDSAQRRSPMLDSAPRQSPMRDSAPRRSPMSDLVDRRSPIGDSTSESESGYAVLLKNGLGSECLQNWTADGVKTGFFVEDSEYVTRKSDKKLMTSDLDVDGGKEVRSKIYIRLRKNKPDDVNEQEKVDDVQEEEKIGTFDGEVEESLPKTWNLRPRKPPNVNGGTFKVENKAQLPPLAHNRPESEQNTADKKRKHKFSISLSREEIEEDIYALTGSKPARRPKKRNRSVQKTLDNLFPGMWLGLVSPDTYKVSENPPKA